MRLLICGDRHWDDRQLIGAVIDELQPAVVIQGKARGADRLARMEAESRGIQVRSFPAEWEVFGKRAGPIRNTQMLKEGNPDSVVAFHDNIGNSKGTADIVNRALRAGLRVAVVSHDAPEIVWQYKPSIKRVRCYDQEDERKDG